MIVKGFLKKNKDFNLMCAPVGDCILLGGVDKPSFRKHELIEFIFEGKYGVQIQKYRHGKKPKWNHEPYVLETVYCVNRWEYCIKTPLKNIVKIWDYINEDKVFKSEILRETTEAWQLLELNMEYLKEQKFISHRANPYQITQTDVNILLNKFKSNINR
jgi:hypothetical protein